MKLTIIILLVGLLQVQAHGYSQQLTMEVNNESLIRVFAMIKKQTGYVYFGATELLAKARPVTFKVKNESVENVLKICFKDQPLDYVIDGKTISVFEKKKEAGFNSSTSPLPMFIDVRGRVINEKNEAVARVSVMVKGTKNGTYTDGDGYFSLNKIDHDAILILTSVNIERLEEAINGRRTLDLKVKGKTGKLDEVQVIAYGKTSQRFNVGNVTTVKAEDIEKQPVQNPLLALQGRVPGLEITQLTGINGGGVIARIQGRNSLNSGLEPLIVIDGVPYPSLLENTDLDGILKNTGQPIGIVRGGSPLNYINPADIESIDVLKDADATAIYGSRAANGAILITTKKGKIGKTKLNINLQQGWGKVTRKVKMMNTRQYLDMRYEAYKNDGIDITMLTPNSSNYDITLWDTTRYTDWQKELIGGTAKYTNISANLSGGNATTQYLIGGTFNRQTTVFPGNFDDKNGGVHFNVSGVSANQKLRAHLSGNYNYDQNYLPRYDATYQALLFAPNAPALYNADGTINWALNAAGSSTWNNPLAAYIQNAEFNNITKNLVSNATLGYSILPGLDVRSSFGYTNLQSRLYQASRMESYRPEDRPFVDRYATFSTRNMGSWIIEPQIQYIGPVSKGKIEALLGATIQRNSSDVLTIVGSGYSSDLMMNSIRAAKSIGITVFSTSMYKYNALFGRLNYNWDNKYLINLTARRDGSSRFGDKNKFHNFGSVGLGWIFSEEKWVQKTLGFLSFGKIRSSFGTTGNDQIADYSYLSLYTISGSGIPYQNTSGLGVFNIPNPHLQWEETRKWQWGMDLGFLNDRILLNATIARNRSSNQLIGYTIPSTTGYTGITQNFPATIQNTSWEFTMNTINIKRKDFNWTSSFNLTLPQNKLLNFPGIEKTSYGSPFSNVIVGQPLGLIRLYRYSGVDSATGDYQVFDKDGKPTVYNITGIVEETVLISDLTKYYGGIQNSINFKGFQLDFLMQFVRVKGPKDLYYSNGNNSLNPGMFHHSGTNQPVTVLNRWQKPGDETPIGRYNTNGSLALWPPYTDANYTYDASYIRLKNLSLSWQLPATWLQKAHMQNARLYFRGQNLFTITNYTGLDPESRSISSLPPLQMWTIGLQMEL